VKKYEKAIKARLTKNISHQNIGGKEILIERETTLDYFLDKDFDKMVIAEMNFLTRRTDLLTLSDETLNKIKAYYGHVGMLGYWVCEDEIEEVLEGEL
jgi:hypothetical protein